MSGRVPNVIGFITLIALATVFVACGGGSNTATNGVPFPTPSPASGAAVQVSMGDAPADWIASFGMSVDSITLTNSSGGTVSMLSTATPIEMMQLMGATQPLNMMTVPQGTYTSATITMSSVQMGYMDPGTKQYVQKNMAGPFTGTMNFNPPMTVGTTASSLNFDMNMASSVAIDGSGNVTITPTFAAMMNPLASGQNPWQGGMHHLVGAVTAVSGSQFTMNTMMGQQSPTFSTDGNTHFTGMSGMGAMSNGMVIAVDATRQTDGTLLAQHVEAMWSHAGGMMGSGIVTAITGNPPTQLTMVANNGIGGGMMMSAISGDITVNTPANTPYSYDADGVDVTNLPFVPSFDESTIALGQKIDAVSGSMMGGGGMMGGGTGVGTINASAIRLEQQALHGTVSGYASSGSQATFTLTLPSDSAFATLTGTSSVTVYQQAQTQMHNLTSIADGDEVETRGLLFYANGTYRLVSTWIVGQ